MQSHSHPNLSYKGEGWGCESKERETTYLYVGWNITLVTGALCPVNSYLQGETERSELNYLLNNNLSLDGNLSGGLGIQSVDSLVLRVAPKINRTQVPSDTKTPHYSSSTYLPPPPPFASPTTSFLSPSPTEDTVHFLSPLSLSLTYANTPVHMHTHTHNHSQFQVPFFATE